MMHAFHEDLAGYDARQIWHDGCPECEGRSLSLPMTIASLDKKGFRRAWQRAMDWNTDKNIGVVSRAEMPLLTQLWCMQLIMQRYSGLPSIPS